MVFAWFDTKEVDSLADQLVADFISSSPPGSLTGSSKKLQKSHDKVLDRARAFVLTRTVNVYKKARMAGRFKWALIEAGYPAWFVTEMVYELAAVVAAAKADADSRKSSP